MRDRNSEFETQAFDIQARLRREAETRLQQGAAPPSCGWALGADALTLLCRLSSNPDTAADALKLLSELQTHQVELDLQHAQLEADQQELADALSHYRALYEFAPVGYLVVGLDGQIFESNRAGDELLGAGPGELAGQLIIPWFAEDYRAAVLGVVEACREGALGVCCAVAVSGDQGNDQVPLRISATLGPAGDAALMIVSRCDSSAA